jgi:hypothetical protein
MNRVLGSSLKTVSLVLGTVIALFVATQCFHPGTLSGRTTTGKAASSSSVTVELKGGVGPAGPQPHLW